MPLRECSSSPVDKSSSRTAAPLNVCSKERDQVGGRSPRSGLAEGRGQQGIQVRPALLYPSIGAPGAMIETGLGETAAAFVSSSPWGRKLERLDLERVLDSTKERIVPKRGAVVRASSVAQFWVGIISGLVVQSVTNSDGHASFLSAASDGAWFGEGTLMKRERWGYDAVALQETRVALIFVVAGLPGWPACSEEGGTIMRFAEKSAWSAGDYPLVPTAMPSPPDAGLGEHRR
jgi:hypothetical protein